MTENPQKAPLFALGRHMTVEYCGCDPKIISDPDKVEAAFLDAAKYSGANVLNWSFHRFAPQGVSGFVIISESHFSIHAWPEHDYAAVDIFTCGGSVSHDKAVARLKELLGAREAVVSSDMCRGTVFKGVGRCPGFASKKGDDANCADCAAGIEKLLKRSGSYSMLCAIDARNIDKTLLSDIPRVVEFLTELERMSMPEGARPAKFASESFEDGANVVVHGYAADHSVSARFDAKAGGAFIELIARKYFDPRECGERAVKGLKASGYRLHLALRM
jgi:S-adenosylmethionine decarboxylase